MLTIQPSFTNQAYRKVPAFKGETRDDNFYEQKTNYYEAKKQEFENLANDTQTPKALKNIAKTFKIVSTMLLEGWAVAWGASKGARFAKESVVKGINSDFTKNTTKALKPMFETIVKAGKKLGEFATKGIKYIKATPTYTKLSEKVSAVITKMDNNKFGKIVLDGLRAIGKGIKKVANLIANPLKKHYAEFKTKSFDAMYDKAAKTTATTLGVGAGAASGYNEVVHPERTVTDENEENNQYEKIKPEEEEDEA